MKILWLSLLTLGSSTVAIAQDDCSNMMDAVTKISTALDEALLDEASAVAAKAQKDLLCQTEPVNHLVLTSVFHMAGAVHLFLGEEEESWEAFGFSASIAPMATLDPVLGAQAQESHEVLRQSVIAAPQGSIQFSGEAEVWLDGKSAMIGPSIDMTAGKHFIQWRSPGGDMQNRIIRVESGEARAIPVGPGAEIFSGETIGGSSLEAKHWAMIGGGVGIVGGGILLALGAKARSDYENTDDPNKLDGLAQKANLYFTLGGVLAGAGVGGLIAGPMFLNDGGSGIQVGFVW